MEGNFATDELVGWDQGWGRLLGERRRNFAREELGRRKGRRLNPRGERKRSWGERDDGFGDIGVLGQTTNRLRSWRIVRVFFSSVIQWNQGLRFLEKDKFFVLVYFGWFYFGTNHMGWMRVMCQKYQDKYHKYPKYPKRSTTSTRSTFCRMK